MIDDGRFRLSRYKTGEVTFYDRHNDPDETNNIAEDTRFAGDFKSELSVAEVLSQTVQEFLAALMPPLPEDAGLIDELSLRKDRLLK